MKGLPAFQRLWIACILASLLVHLLLIWGVDRWLNAQAESRIAAQLEPPDQRPFKFKRRWAVPPGKHAFAGRPAFRTSPRPLKGLSFGTPQEYLEHGIPQGIDTQIGPTDLYSSYQGTDTLFAHPEWEQSALQAWRDSLNLELESQAEWEGPEPLNPFDIETLARGQGRSVVVLDSTGQLARAYCFLPIYGIYVPRFNKMRIGGKPIRNDYADRFHALERSLRELSQVTPLDIQLVAHYQVEADSADSVSPDPIHRWGEFPHREVLTLEQMKQYPFLPLQYIDVESTESLAQYVVEGGFASLGQKQLNRLEIELSAHAELQVRQIEIDPGHPLMKAYYSLAGYHIQGLEVNGRLAAITQPAGQLLINALVYVLMQPGSLVERFEAR